LVLPTEMALTQGLLVRANIVIRDKIENSINNRPRSGNRRTPNPHINLMTLQIKKNSNWERAYNI
jgi:hypothetical protein